MEDKLFKPAGRFSKVWYLKVFKDNPERRGFSWIRMEHNGAPQFQALKQLVGILIDQRYLDIHGKPDGKGSTYHRLTSLGHRYLEEHKDELVSEEIDQAQQRIQKKNEEIADEGLKKLHSDPLFGKRFPVERGQKDSKYTDEDFLEPHRKEKLKPMGIIPTDDEKPANGFVMKDKDGNIAARSELSDEEYEKLADEIVTPPVDPPGSHAEQGQAEMPVDMMKQLADYQKQQQKQMLRGIVGEIFVEKFADKVTVKELLDYFDEPKEAAIPEDDEKNW